MITRRELRLRDALLALLIAPLGAAIPSLVQTIMTPAGDLPELLPMASVPGNVLAIALAGALLVVFPILAVAPAVRQPPGFVAAICGGVVSVLLGAVILGDFRQGHVQFPSTLSGFLRSCAPGVLSGFTYAMVANRLAQLRSARPDYF